MESLTPTATVRIRPNGTLDRRNAALYLGLAPKTLAEYASRGIGPAFLKRGRVVYRLEDLDAWTQTGHRGPGVDHAGPGTSKV